jgi:hypothetical protein
MVYLFVPFLSLSLLCSLSLPLSLSFILSLSLSLSHLLNEIEVVQETRFVSCLVAREFQVRDHFFKLSPLIQSTFPVADPRHKRLLILSPCNCVVVPTLR